MCPSLKFRAESAAELVPWDALSKSIPWCGYMANGVIFTHGSVLRGVNMDSIPNPAGIIMINDERVHNGNSAHSCSWPVYYAEGEALYSWWPITGGYDRSYQLMLYNGVPVTDYWGPHNYGFSCAYCDGHAEWISQTCLFSRDLGLIPGDSQEVYDATYTAAF